MLASNGLATPPCGVPRALLLPPLMRRFPSPSRSSIGAFSHSLISRSTAPSAIRRATDFINSLCGIVSKYLEVSVHHIGVAPADQPVHFLDRIHRPANGTVAIRTVLEVSLEDWFQHKLGSGLNHTIADGRYSESSLAAIRFRYAHPPHRIGPIRLRDQFLTQPC